MNAPVGAHGAVRWSCARCGQGGHSGTFAGAVASLERHHRIHHPTRGAA